MARLTNRIYLKHMRDKGALLQRLFSDPSMVKIVNERRKPLKQITTRYLMKLVAEKYGLPANLSKFGINLSAGLTFAAANYVFTESNVDFQLAWREKVQARPAYIKMSEKTRLNGIPSLN